VQRRSPAAFRKRRVEDRLDFVRRDQGGCLQRCNALRQRSLGHEREIQFPPDYLLLQQFVFAHVAADVRGNHARFQHFSHAEAVYTHVVADGVKSLCSTSNERINQVFRYAAKTKPAQHNCRAIENIEHRFVRRADNLPHAFPLWSAWAPAPKRARQIIMQVHSRSPIL